MFKVYVSLHERILISIISKRHQFSWKLILLRILFYLGREHWSRWIWQHSSWQPTEGQHRHSRCKSRIFWARRSAGYQNRNRCCYKYPLPNHPTLQHSGGGEGLGSENPWHSGQRQYSGYWVPPQGTGYENCARTVGSCYLLQICYVQLREGFSARTRDTCLYFPFYYFYFETKNG